MKTGGGLSWLAKRGWAPEGARGSPRSGLERAHSIACLVLVQGVIHRIARINMRKKYKPNRASAGPPINLAHPY